MRRFILLLSLVLLLLVSLSLTERAAAPDPAGAVTGIRRCESALPKGGATITDMLHDGTFQRQEGAPSALQDRPRPARDTSASAAGTQTFTSVADAAILEGYPDVSFAETEDMWVGVDESFDPPMEPAGICRSLVRFDLSGLDAPTVGAATLRIYLINSWDRPDVDHIVSAHRVASGWSEQQVTWSSAPPPAESYGSLGVTHAAWGWYELDVTGLVQAWVNGTYANHGIILVGEEEGLGRRGFSTREGSHPPELVVEFDTVPPSPTATRTPTRTPTPTATRPAAGLRVYLPLVLRGHASAPRPSPSPTQTTRPSPSPTEPSGEEWVYKGTTSQDREIEFKIKSDQSAMTYLKINYSFYCGGVTTTGTTTISSAGGWPITDRSFEVESSCNIEVTGTFDPSFNTASGTWQGIACDPIRPWIEVCRGPVGTWNATRQ